MKTLQDRVAVVTGAAGGIGLAIAEAFLAEGMRVVLADIDRPVLDAEVERLAEVGEVLGVVTNVADQASVDALAATAADRFGAVHVIVNNAGVSAQGNSWEMSHEEWERVLGVNLWGVIHGIRSFVPRLLANGDEGHVVNTASMASVTATPRLAAYTAAKAGVLGLSDSLRGELRKVGAPIGVSVVMPGMIRSRMNTGSTTPPSAVSVNVVDALYNDRRYVYSDGELTSAMEKRFATLLAAKADVLPPPDTGA